VLVVFASTILAQFGAVFIVKERLALILFGARLRHRLARPGPRALQFKGPSAKLH